MMEKRSGVLTYHMSEVEQSWSRRKVLARTRWSERARCEKSKPDVQL